MSNPFIKVLPADASPVNWLTGNTDYIFGIQTGTSPTNARVWRRDKDGNESYIADFSDESLIVSEIIAFDEIQFADIRDGSSLHYLYVSRDNGASWRKVKNIGEVNGTHYANISILGERGMCRAVLGGVVTYIYGEYNTRAETGGAEDGAVRLWKSTDGTNWEVFLEWNTDGSFYVSHCHLVRQDPYTDYIYVGLGDGNASGIIQWDGSTDVSASSNQLPADMNGDAGLKAFGGTKKYQCTDLLFEVDRILNPADNYNAAGVDDGEQGIWEFPRDFSYYRRVARPNAQFAYHNLYWAVTFKDQHFVCEIINPSATGSNLLVNYIYGCRVGTDDWQIVGKVILNNNAAGGGPKGFFVWNDQIIFSWNDFGYSLGDWSYFYSYDGYMLNYDKNNQLVPDVWAPIAWVGPTGADTTSGDQGYYPDLPYLTVLYALTGNRVLQGGRILVQEGTYLSNAITLAFATLGKAGVAFGSTMDYPVVVEGLGSSFDDVKIALSSGSSDTTFLTVPADGLDDGNGNFPGDQPIRFVNCWIASEKASVVLIDSSTHDNAKAEYYGAHIGDASVAANRVVWHKGAQELVFNRCKLEKDVTGNIILQARDNASILMLFCVCVGGSYVFRNGNAGGRVRAFSCLFDGYDTAGVNIYASASKAVEMVGCIGYTPTSGVDLIQHPAGIPVNPSSHHNLTNEDMVNTAITKQHSKAAVYSGETIDGYLTDRANGDYTPLKFLSGGHMMGVVDYNGNFMQGGLRPLGPIMYTAANPSSRDIAGARPVAARAA